MGLFRCMNADCADDSFEAHPSHDFENKTGICPKCGESNKNAPDLVLVRVAVHYLVNDPAGPIKTRNGGRRVACAPELRRLIGSHQCTSVRAAVTCPDCLASEVFAQHEQDDVDQGVNIVRKGTPI